MTTLKDYIEDHRFLVQAAAGAAGIVDPVSINLGEMEATLLLESRRGEFLPLDGVLVRDWSRYWPKYWPGADLGARVYTSAGIRFARVVADVHGDLKSEGYRFFIVAKADYLKLFRRARQCHRKRLPPGPPPVLPDELVATLEQNTIKFLEPKNLKRIRELGGRPKRGLLFSGPPGNGKTSACRWIMQQCNLLGHEVKQVTPDDYRAARNSCNPAAAVRELFKVTGTGVIFFDDMDMALRDRSDLERPEDQAVFLGAMDGIETHESLVYIFTTNLPLDRIDPAFKRPGRLDLTLSFPKPTAELRRRLVDRWHEDIRGSVDVERIVREMEGRSFAEIEEHKNLMVLGYLNREEWSWDWACEQFERNRDETMREKGTIGFSVQSPLPFEASTC